MVMTIDKQKELFTAITDRIQPIYRPDFFTVDEAKYDDGIEELLFDQEFLNNEWESDEGATKFVIVPRNENYVIKIPFTHYYEGDIDDYAELQFSDYGRSLKPGDYCDIEVERYKVFKKYGLEKFFAETQFLGSYHDFDFYIQQKVTPHNRNSHKKQHSKETENSAKRLRFAADETFNLEWLMNAIDYYGEDEVEELVDFLGDNNYLSDYHGGNLGYIEDRPVILDYSGFEESYHNTSDENLYDDEGDEYE